MAKKLGKNKPKLHRFKFCTR